MVESIPSYFMVPHRCSASSQRVLRGAFFLSLLIAIPTSLSRSISLGRSHQVWERVGVFSPCLTAPLPSSENLLKEWKNGWGSRARLVGLPNKFDPVPTSTVPTFTGHPTSRWLLRFGHNWRS